jgi:two-component system LytT family response regulator
VPVGEALQLIDSATVEWLEASDNYVHVHTTARSYILRRTLQDLLEQLGDRQFARIHKSAAVNISAVKAFTPLFKGDYEVQLSNGKVLRLSRRFKDQLFGRMGK